MGTVLCIFDLLVEGLHVPRNSYRRLSYRHGRCHLSTTQRVEIMKPCVLIASTVLSGIAAAASLRVREATNRLSAATPARPEIGPRKTWRDSKGKLYDDSQVYSNGDDHSVDNLEGDWVRVTRTGVGNNNQEVDPSLDKLIGEVNEYHGGNNEAAGAGSPSKTTEEKIAEGWYPPEWDDPVDSSETSNEGVGSDNPTTEDAGVPSNGGAGNDNVVFPGPTN